MNAPDITRMPASDGYCAQEPSKPFLTALRGYGNTPMQASADLHRVLKMVGRA